MTVRRTHLADDTDPSPVFGVDAISLVTRLTMSCWALAAAGGSSTEPTARAEMPVRFVPRAPRS